MKVPVNIKIKLSPICYDCVLEELPYADTVEKLEALLPWNVKAVLES